MRKRQPRASALPGRIGMKRRLLRVTSVAAVLAVSLSGCIFLPSLAGLSSGPPAPPLPTATDPIPPTSEPPSIEPTPVDPTPTETPSPTQDSGTLGEVRDGNPLQSGSGVATDTPYDLVIPPSSGNPQVGSVPLGDVSNAREFSESEGSFITQTTGRLYMTWPGDRHGTCSGTVVNSDGGNIVLTAAHCLYSPIYREMAERVQFVPAESGNGAHAPYGTWEGDRWIVPSIFADTAYEEDGASYGEGWAYDYAWIRLHSSDSGANVQDFTGGQGISFTQEFDGAQFVGYPTNEPFDGSSQRVCSSTQMGFGDMHWPHLTMSCTISPGISGSGWVTAVDPDTGAGYVGAVFSTLVTDTVSGSMLGRNSYDLLQELHEL